jgi:hypothetical protein
VEGGDLGFQTALSAPTLTDYGLLVLLICHEVTYHRCDMLWIGALTCHELDDRALQDVVADGQALTVALAVAIVPIAAIRVVITSAHRATDQARLTLVVAAVEQSCKKGRRQSCRLAASLWLTNACEASSLPEKRLVDDRRVIVSPDDLTLIDPPADVLRVRNDAADQVQANCPILWLRLGPDEGPPSLHLLRQLGGDGLHDDSLSPTPVDYVKE